MLSQSMESMSADWRRQQRRVWDCEKVPVGVPAFTCYLVIASLLGFYLEQASNTQARRHACLKVTRDVFTEGSSIWLLAA